MNFIKNILSLFAITSVTGTYSVGAGIPDMTAAQDLWNIPRVEKLDTPATKPEEEEKSAESNNPPPVPPVTPEPKKEDEKPIGDPDIDTEVIYKVGDKEIPESQYQEYFSNLVEKYGIETVEKMNAESLEVLMKEQANIIQARKTANKNHQNNAQEKRNLEKEKGSIESEREDLSNKKREFEEESKAKAKDIEDQLKFLEDRRKKFRDEIRKNKDILEAQPEDEYDEEERQELKINQKFATRDNNKLEEEISDIEKKIKHTSDSRTQLQEEAQLIETYNNMQELQIVFPELKTSEPVLAILERYQIANKAGQDFDGEELDLMRASRIYTIITSFNEQNIDNNIARFYKRVKHNLPELSSAAQSDKVRKTVKEVRTDNIKDVIRDLLKKQKSPSNPNGLGASHSTASHTNGATKEIAQEEYRNKTGWNTQL